MELTLRLENQRASEKYEFAALDLQENDQQTLQSLRGYNFKDIKQFEIPCSDMVNPDNGSLFVEIYVQRPSSEHCKWGKMTSIRYPPEDAPPIPSTSNDVADDVTVSMHDLITTLQKTCDEIIDGARFLEQRGLQLNRRSEWISEITDNPSLFAETRYRRKLVIERLIVELNLWSTDWMHRILEQKKRAKPMLQWLVEDRKVAKLHDHYRVFTSLNVHSSALLNCRWLTFDKRSRMTGKAGFGRAKNSCFRMTEFKADGILLPLKLFLFASLFEHQSSIDHNSDLYAATDLNTKNVEMGTLRI